MRLQVHYFKHLCSCPTLFGTSHDRWPLVCLGTPSVLGSLPWGPRDVVEHQQDVTASPDLLTLLSRAGWCNTLRTRQNGRHFPDGILKCIFLNENVWITIRISLTFVPEGPINNIPTFVQIMAWRQSGDKPLSDAIMSSIYTSLGLNDLRRKYHKISTLC